VAGRLQGLKRIAVGEQPRALVWLMAPTLVGCAMDLVLRPGALAGFALQGKAIYGSSLLISAASWTLPLALACWLLQTGRRAALVVLLALWVLPMATMGFAGQLVYRRVFGSYMGRDTLRLGIALRGTVVDWLTAWGGPWLLAGILAAGGALTYGAFVLVRRQAPRLGRRIPLLPVLTFGAALFCYWTDNVDSRFLQAATPDVCFEHGVVHALRMALTGQWNVRHGVSVRTPAALPALTSWRARPPSVLVILTESVRADSMCSEPPPRCVSEGLDTVAADRIPLGKLTTQAPNTFTSSVILWTGLGADLDFTSAHTAPVLWEIARAVGYRTAYVTSQNTQYEDFGAFVRRAGIDTLVTAGDLGGLGQEQIGAPDERATEALLRFAREVPTGAPWFAVLHLSNTHAPYRVDTALQPFAPHSDDPLADVGAFHNQQRNSVALQERTLAAMLRELRARPDWSDTAVLLLSDHGEQFREHGGLYHNHSLYEEELRVPGWLVAGDRVLDAAQRASLGGYASRRTYTQDVHETIVDLLGVEDARASLPVAARVTGRSLLRPYTGDPTVVLATTTAVWEADDSRYGATRGERALIGSPGAWQCYDTLRDPGEREPMAPQACGPLAEVLRKAFGAAAEGL
jgi:hypothetical protein